MVQEKNSPGVVPSDVLPNRESLMEIDLSPGELPSDVLPRRERLSFSKLSVRDPPGWPTKLKKRRTRQATQTKYVEMIVTNGPFTDT